MKTHNRITFELAATHAHELVKELEHAISIVNRDTSAALSLWYIINYQLAGSSYDDALVFAKRDIQQKKEMDKAAKEVERLEQHQDRGTLEKIFRWVFRLDTK